MNPRDDDFARLQAHTLFDINADDTLVTVNDIGRPAPPRCFVSVTTTTIHDWTSAAARPEMTDALRRWRAHHRPPLELDSFTAPPDDVLAAVSAAPDHDPLVFSGPAYRFPAANADSHASDGRVRNCPEGSDEILRETFPDLAATLTERQPAVAAFDGDSPVAVCFSSRVGPKACEAGVETLPEHRGQGFASVVTARWAEVVRAEGKTPLYSTSWENRSSRAVARRLGLIRYAVTLSVYAPMPA